MPILGNWPNIKQRNFFVLIAVISTALLVLAVNRAPQGICYDTSAQLKALQQYMKGESPSLNHLVTVNPENLIEDRTRWLSDAPPSMQIIVYPLVKSGISFSDALRIITVICILIGAIGWTSWFLLFRLPIWLMIALAALLPWMRYSSDMLFLYQADILNYAAAPWILLATLSVGRTLDSERDSLFKRPAFFAIFGFCLGYAYLIKYSLVFLSLGALFYMLLKLLGKDGVNLKRRTMNLASIVIFFAIPVICLNLINYRMSGQINIDMIRTKIPLWYNLLSLAGNPALALASAENLYKYILPVPLVFVGLPGGLLLWWILLRLRTFKDHELLALASLLITSVAIFTLWILPTNISYQTRHITPASMAVLPLLVQAGFDLFKKAGRPMLRMVLVSAGMIYIALPLVCGVVSVSMKIIRAVEHKVGGLYNPTLTRDNVASVINKLMKDFSPRTDIWYFTWSSIALDLPGRMILNPVEFTDMDLLRQKKYMSPVRLRIFALLHPDLEKNGRGRIVRDSFPQAKIWEKEEVGGCDYVLWKTVLKPSLTYHKKDYIR